MCVCVCVYIYIYIYIYTHIVLDYIVLCAPKIHIRFYIFSVTFFQFL